VTSGVLTVSLVVARKESSRDPGFPFPVGRRGSSNYYDPADLMAWQRNRPRAVS
jgi:hypothetical protein